MAGLLACTGGCNLRKLLLLPALLVVFLTRALRPVFLVRFGVLVSGRIGHLVGNTEVYLCEREAGMQPRGWLGGVDLWTHVGEPCNAQVVRMVARELHVLPALVGQTLYRLNRCFAGRDRHVVQTEQQDRDVRGHYAAQRAHLRLNAWECGTGAIAARALGIPEGARWVCLIVRDGAYLPGLTYHSYRDSDVDTYAQAALELAQRGYYVVRMGAKVEKPFRVEHERVIDYATSGLRSDFMDVYLASECEFAVSSGTGLDAVCVVARLPVCFVNYAPLEYLNTWVEGVAIWKRHFRDGREMSPREIYESGAGVFMRSEQFAEAGITLVDNTPEEIRDAVLEMEAIHRGRHMPYWREQAAFWRAFPKDRLSEFNGKSLHGPRRLRIGSAFLRSQERKAA